MAPAAPPTLRDLLDLMQACAEALPAGERLVLVHLAGGEERARVELAGAAPARAPAPPPRLALSETELAIVTAIGGGPAVTGEEIADLAGFAHDGWLRGQLASMRRRGILTGSRGEPGYAVAPGYLPAE